MIVEENKMFNLMDTNGRRSDVANALKGYLILLDDILRNDEWDRIPNNFSQYKFYVRTLEMFPDVFKKHEPYDNFINLVQSSELLKRALENEDIEWVRKNYNKYADILLKVDNGIEDRARHYTSTLVKLGFTYENRKISNTGKTLIEKNSLNKDNIEKILPIDTTNIIYLRQLLKLKIYNKDKDKFYSPFFMALYLLLKNKRITESIFLDIIQSTNPYKEIIDIDSYIENNKYEIDNRQFEEEIPNIILSKSKIKEEEFIEIFFNSKSSKTKNSYYNFYNAIFQFYESKTIKNLKELISIYESSKSILNKAFGCNAIFLHYNNKTINNVEKFIDDNKEIFCVDNINIQIYKMFACSKYFDLISEYSDTTKRIFNTTGVISFKNGYVELAYREIFEKIFDANDIKKQIYGDAIDYENDNAKFYDNCSLTEILNINNIKVEKIIDSLNQEFHTSSIDDISKMILSKRNNEFKLFIEEKYPIEKIKLILDLFNDRKNDNKIKMLVSEDASVPTIFEYIAGIAWYYFSAKSINLLESYNLSLSADFEPLVHAGGGQGDINIYTDKDLILLEITLMDKNAQKRAEWEPVLRHSANCKIDEEKNGNKRRFTSFFIADEFDKNTINIWKNMYNMPFESSIKKDEWTTNMIIMPISNRELSQLMYNSEIYYDFIEKVHKLFAKKEKDFDIDWHKNFMSEILC